MSAAELICTSVSPEGYVATFRIKDTDEEVFAYLPHVPGLNPYLLKEGDSIAGEIGPKNGRVELILATRQVDRRATPSG